MRINIIKALLYKNYFEYRSKTVFLILSSVFQTAMILTFLYFRIRSSLSDFGIKMIINVFYSYFILGYSILNSNLFYFFTQHIERTNKKLCNILKTHVSIPELVLSDFIYNLVLVCLTIVLIIIYHQLFLVFFTGVLVLPSFFNMVNLLTVFSLVALYSFLRVITTYCLIRYQVILNIVLGFLPFLIFMFGKQGKASLPYSVYIIVIICSSLLLLSLFQFIQRLNKGDVYVAIMYN